MAKREGEREQTQLERRREKSKQIEIEEESERLHQTSLTLSSSTFIRLSNTVIFADKLSDTRSNFAPKVSTDCDNIMSAFENCSCIIIICCCCCCMAASVELVDEEAADWGVSGGDGEGAIGRGGERSGFEGAGGRGEGERKEEDEAEEIGGGGGTPRRLR